MVLEVDSDFGQAMETAEAFPVFGELGLEAAYRVFWGLDPERQDAADLDPEQGLLGAEGV